MHSCTHFFLHIIVMGLFNFKACHIVIHYQLFITSIPDMVCHLAVQICNLKTISSKQQRDISDGDSVSIRLSLIILDCYRSQGKVMFSEASVCSRGGSPFRGTETTLERNPLDREPPLQRPPGTETTATAAVGTNPTGMHSCFYLKLYYIRLL